MNHLAHAACRPSRRELLTGLAALGASTLLPAQTPGDLLQQTIAGVVPERVVDFLESVEVDDGNRRRSSRFPTPAKYCLHTGVEVKPIWKIRKCIMFGQIGIRSDLSAEPTADKCGNPKQDEVQKGQADSQVPV